MCVVCHYTIGLALALLLNRPLRGRAVYRILLILPWAVPAFVSAFAWKLIFDRDAGLINAIMGTGTDWFDSTPKALTAVIIVNVWLGVPFMMVAVLGGLQSIRTSSTRPRRWTARPRGSGSTNVTLPGLRSVGSASIILLGTIWTFNMFPIIYIVLPRRTWRAATREILVTGAFREAFEGHPELLQLRGMGRDHPPSHPRSCWPSVYRRFAAQARARSGEHSQPLGERSEVAGNAVSASRSLLHATLLAASSPPRCSRSSGSC